MIEMIPLVRAWNLPETVQEWCALTGIDAHHQNDVAYIDNDENPFWQWLLEQGLANNAEQGMWVAILGD